MSEPLVKYWTNSVMTLRQMRLCNMHTSPIYLADDVEEAVIALWESGKISVSARDHVLNMLKGRP